MLTQKQLFRKVLNVKERQQRRLKGLPAVTEQEGTSRQLFGDAIQDKLSITGCSSSGNGGVSSSGGGGGRSVFGSSSGTSSSSRSKTNNYGAASHQPRGDDTDPRKESKREQEDATTPLSTLINKFQQRAQAEEFKRKFSMKAVDSNSEKGGILNTPIRKEPRVTTFNNEVHCCLVPSRTELEPLIKELYWAFEDYGKFKDEAIKEIRSLLLSGNYTAKEAKAILYQPIYNDFLESSSSGAPLVPNKASNMSKKGTRKQLEAVKQATSAFKRNDSVQLFKQYYADEHENAVKATNRVNGYGSSYVDYDSGSSDRNSGLINTMDNTHYNCNGGGSTRNFMANDRGWEENKNSISASNSNEEVNEIKSVLGFKRVDSVMLFKQQYAK